MVALLVAYLLGWIHPAWLNGHTPPRKDCAKAGEQREPFAQFQPAKVVRIPYRYPRQWTEPQKGGAPWSPSQ